jgi:hypothetical protein
MTPRSSDPGGEHTPLRGTPNLRLTANQHCNGKLPWGSRGRHFPRPGPWLSYRPPGSLLESRRGSLLVSAEAEPCHRHMVRARSLSGNPVFRPCREAPADHRPLHEFPQAIEIATGRVIHRWTHVCLGQQVGAIELGDPPPPLIALDPRSDVLPRITVVTLGMG